MKTDNLFIQGDYKLYPLIDAYFKFLGGKNNASFQFTNIDSQYYIEKDNNIEITTLKKGDIRIKNILDMPFYLKGGDKTRKIFDKLGIYNDSRFDCSYSNYVYYIENDNLHDRKTVNGILIDSMLGDFIRNNWFDATDILTEIFYRDKPKSIKEFDEMGLGEDYELENDAELLTKLLRISYIYNNNNYPDWTTETMKYSIKHKDGKLCIFPNCHWSSCIAFDDKDAAKNYLEIFKKDLEKVKYWL